MYLKGKFKFYSCMVLSEAFLPAVKGVYGALQIPTQPLQGAPGWAAGPSGA